MAEGDLTVYDSFIRLTYSPGFTPITLVDFGDMLWGPILIDGSQLVEVQSFVRALGISTFPRGNERHTLSFDRCRREATLADAFAARMDAILSLPRLRADVLLELEDGRAWRILNCSVESWPSEQTEFLTREGVRIIGGQLVQDEGGYGPGTPWGHISTPWGYL